MAKRWLELLRENKRVAIVAACAIVFLVLLEDVLEGGLIKLDEAAYVLIVEHLRTDWLTPIMESISALATPVTLLVMLLLIVEHLRTDWLTPIMESISALATPVTLLVMLLLIVAFAPGRRPGACCALNLALVVVLNQVLKFLVQRPRPEGFRLAAETGFSFPSGHSMAAMAFFGLLIWMVWHYERDRAVRIGCSVALAALIVAVGVSRIYLGVHYASDVVAGFCVSLAWLALYTRVVAPLFLGEAPVREAEAKNSD